MKRAILEDSYGQQYRLRQGRSPKKVDVSKIKKRPMGRPSTYREGYAPLVYKLRLLGLSIVEIASIFEISEVQLLYWKNNIPEFKKAWTEGGQLADAKVAASLYHRAIGYSYESERVFPSTQHRNQERMTVVEHVPPDIGAIRTWLFNRDPERWKNSISQEVSGPNGAPLIPPAIVVNPIQAVRFDVENAAPTIAGIVVTDEEGNQVVEGS